VLPELEQAIITNRFMFDTETIKNWEKNTCTL